MSPSRLKPVFHILIFCAVLASLLGISLGVTVPARAAGTCYVNAAASAPGTGADWANAYTSLQSALADSCTEIWVAAGTYTPAASDRTVSFMLKDNTAIYGGFDGTETSLSERDPVANVTILSGDLAGNDSGTNDGSNASYNENSYHVAWANGDPTPIANATLDGFTITGGYADLVSGAYTYYDSGAGMWNFNSSTTLANLIFRNNYAQNVGGGMYINYINAPTLTNVTFSGNYAASSGGGLYITASSATLTNVTFSGNSASGDGGGLDNFWLAPALTNVTFSGNTAGGNGGGMYNVSNTDPTLTNVTFSGNSASLSGGGLYNDGSQGGAALLKNVIIANSTGGGDCVVVSGSLNGTSSNNLIEGTGSNACGLSNGVNGNIIGTDPGLSALADHGGATQTHLPGVGSAAIDAGTNTGCPASDQRGVSRPQHSTCDIGAVETLIVSNSNDSSAGSLRQAIADARGDVITFDASLSGATINLASTLDITSDLTIDGSALASKITISGDSDQDADGDVRVFYVGSGVTATLNSLIVTKGFSGTNGGGALLNDGTTTIINSVFPANTVDNQYGGAILNNPNGTLTVTGSTFSGNVAFNGGAIGNLNQLTITNSTFSGNSSGDTGGAIYNNSDIADQHNVLTITNSTFSANSANYGGGVWSEQPMTVRNSTFSGNEGTGAGSTGAGIWQEIDQLNFTNTIIANSVGGGGDCFAVSGIAPASTNNLVRDGSCAATLSGDPNLGALASNGGPTQTFALLPGSPAIGAGDNTICDDNPGPNNLDQRGIARPNGDNCDIGAYEHEDAGGPSVTAFDASDATSLNVPITTFTASDEGRVTGYLVTESTALPTLGASWVASAPTSYTVANAGNHTLYPWVRDDAGNISTVYGSPDSVSVCLSSVTVTSNADSGAGTLRQAITDACSGATITFHSSLSGDTIHLASTLTLTKDVTIDGSSLASQITLSGDSDNNGTGDVRVIHLNNDALLDVTLDSLTITKGQSSEAGAILNEAYLTITNSTFSNNSSSGYAGAISSYRPLTITNSAFSGNSSTGSGAGGGAILNSSTLTISGSTFSGNTADAGDGSGGAIYTTSPGTTITNSTFSGNSAAAGGAILTTNALTITNSTISGNSAIIDGGLSIQGNTTNLRNTIIANSTGGDCFNGGTLGANTNNLIEDGSCSPALSGDPNLGPLANNGGPTQTLALLPGSKALDAGDDSICDDNPGPNNLDQRASARPQGPHCDIGAFEMVEHTISGNAGVGGATLSYTDGVPQTVMADVSGNYILAVSNNWAGMVTPSKTGYFFLPANRNYSSTPVTTDQTAQNYTATLNVIPALLTPANGAQLLNNQQITFDWTNASGATQYALQVSKNTSFTVLVINRVVVSSSYTANLPPGLMLYWRVRRNGGAWSVVRSFITANPPSRPVLLLPANNILTSNYTPHLDWKDSTLPANTAFLKYELQLSANDSSFTNLPTTVAITGLPTDSTYTPGTNLTSGTKYFWRVRSYNTDGQYSNWSAVRSFRTVILAPVLNTPATASSTSDRTPTFTWNASPTGATSYTLQVFKNSNFTALVVAVTVHGTSYTPAANLLPSTYYWRVRANGPNGPSLFSTPFRLTIN